MFPLNGSRSSLAVAVADDGTNRETVPREMPKEVCEMRKKIHHLNAVPVVFLL